MTLSERIDELCREKGISKRKLERDAGIAQGSVSKWKTGGYQPNNASLKKVADYFGVSLDFLCGDSDEPLSDQMILNLKRRRESQYCEGLKETKSIQIPVLGKVVAGIPMEAVENILDFEDIPEEMSYLGQFYGLKIVGHSMEPRILEGDVVIVRKQEDAESGDLVIVLVNGDSATCKKLIKNKDGITLQSFNPAFEPMYFSAEDIQTKPVQIIGKVVELRGKY